MKLQLNDSCQNEWEDKVNAMSTSVSQQMFVDKQLSFAIGSARTHYHIRGKVGYGHGGSLLDEDDDLVSHWPDGFMVSEFLSSPLRHQLVEGTREFLVSIIKDICGRDMSDFSLAKYHEFIVEDALHQQVVEKIKHATEGALLPVDVKQIEHWVSETLGFEVTAYHPQFGTTFCFRICRPRSLDHNPPHLDVWMPLLRNAVNLYVPLAGSNEHSSLSLVPKSHYWSESSIERSVPPCKVGRYDAYPLPAVTDCKHGMDMIRPAVGDEEAMLFSPYLIHGGSSNLNRGVTRISLEMRFFRVK